MFTYLFERLEEALIGCLLAAMTLVTFANVVVRYVVNNKELWESSVGITLIQWFPSLNDIVYKLNMPWALELTGYMFAWMVLIGASYGVRVGAHIGVDAFVKMMPRASHRYLAGLVAILGIVYCVILLMGSYDYVMLMYELETEAEDLPIPQWVIYLALPIGLGLLALRLFQVLIKALLGGEVNVLADEARDMIEEHKAQQRTEHPR